MKKKIILLVSNFFNKRDFYRYGIKEMEISFIVEVWDLTNLLYPKLKKQNSDNFSNNIIKTFSDLGKVIKKLMCKKYTHILLVLL